MKKDPVHSVLLPLLLVPIGGLVVLGVCFFLYYVFYLAVEATFYGYDPTMMPTDRVRIGFAVILIILGLLLLRTKWPDLLKGILLTGPIAMLVVLCVLTFYQNLVVAGIIVAAIILGCAYLILRFKKPWFYYLALVISTAGALFYAWPR